MLVGHVRISRRNFFPMERNFDMSVDTHVEKYIYLISKEKVKNHDSYKRQH
jgi:hypothetical protein